MRVFQLSRNRGKLWTPPSRQASPPPWFGLARILPWVDPMKNAARTAVSIEFPAGLLAVVRDPEFMGHRKLPPSFQTTERSQTPSAAIEAGTCTVGALAGVILPALSHAGM